MEEQGKDASVQGQASASSSSSSTGATSPPCNVNLKCTTEDGKVVDVPLSVMRSSHLIDQMVKDLGQESNQEIEIPVQLESRVFAKVIDWCKTHEGQPDPVVKEDPMTREREWFKLNEDETKFLGVPIDELVELMTASNYLDIRSLYLYSCQTFASHLKGKSPQEIRDMLGIEKDLTEEEEEEIRRQNVWCNY